MAHFDRVQYTIVGLDPRTGPAVGLIDSSLQLEPEDKGSWISAELRNWDESTNNLGEALRAHLKCSNEQIRSMARNVRFMTLEVWTAEDDNAIILPKDLWCDEGETQA